MKIAVIGTGYVGLVTGVCLADLGHTVVCIDNDAAKIARLRAGECPIYEPGLEAVMSRSLAADRLSFATSLAAVPTDCAAVFVAVGTPQAANGEADLGAVRGVAADIAAWLTDFAVIVVKSTVPPGTGDMVEAVIRSLRPEAEFSMASNPEFLREGCAIEDFMTPDRIVVGVSDARAETVLKAIYAPLTDTGARLLVTDRRTSELVKYASNAFLAVKIAFINEMADLCEAIGADGPKVAEGMGLDSRIGSRFLAPGPGYGGSCFPKDTLALARTASDAGVPLSLVEATARSNALRKQGLAHRVEAAVGPLEGRTIGVLGLTFKAGTDDMRDAASLDLIPALQAAGARVQAYDPQGMHEAARRLSDVVYREDPMAAARDVDGLVILTEWEAFAGLDLDALRQAMRAPVVMDFRNLYDPEVMRAHGLNYVSVGRGPARGADARKEEDGAAIIPIRASRLDGGARFTA